MYLDNYLKQKNLRGGSMELKLEVFHGLNKNGKDYYLAISYLDIAGQRITVGREFVPKSVAQIITDNLNIQITEAKLK